MEKELFARVAFVAVTGLQKEHVWSFLVTEDLALHVVLCVFKCFFFQFNIATFQPLYSIERARAVLTNYFPLD